MGTGTRLPDSDIARIYEALSFFDPKGFRYYIPAFMVWSLSNYRNTPSLSAESTLFHLSILDTPDKYDSSRLAILDERQRGAIALFLLYFAADPWAGEEPRQAIHGFWHQYLPDAFRDSSGR